MAFDRREQWLGGGIQMEVETEVDDDEALQFGVGGLIASEEENAPIIGRFSRTCYRRGKNAVHGHPENRCRLEHKQHPADPD